VRRFNPTPFIIKEPLDIDDNDTIEEIVEKYMQ
jgi:hypothetical protein